MAPLSRSKKLGHRKPTLPKSLSIGSNSTSGYQNRKSRFRSIKSSLGISDVYNYEQEKVKRANVTLQLDKEEAGGVDAGSGEDDQEDDARFRRPRLLGENQDDEKVATDDDEEIDSDEAFEESDDERYAGFAFKKKSTQVPKSKSKSKSSQKNVHFAEVDLNEDDREEVEATRKQASEESSDEHSEEEGEDDEFIDVLDVLDGRGEAYMESDDEKAIKSPTSNLEKVTSNEVQRNRSGDEGSGDEEDEEESVDDAMQDEEDVISASEDEGADGAIERLGDFVSGLPTAGAKRKAERNEDEAADPAAPNGLAKKRKTLLKDRTEGGVESEFGARAAGSSKLSFSDLINPLSKTTPSLLKTLKSVSSNSAKSQPLPAPLPQRSQEKLEREAAYEQTKKEVDKWGETMKRIKEAEHLSFPLQVEKPEQPSTLELTAKFKPTTALESSIDKLLKKAKLREQDLPSTEALLTKHLSVEEVAERRAELRKMRELAFRADLKAKRVAKIKSKAYRRMLKKEREREKRKLDAAGEGGDELDEEDRMKMEIERARERATLKHKNTGKWAKAMKNRGELDDDQRRDINEMLDRGEKLRRRIHGQASGSEDEDGDEDSGDEGTNSRAFDELAKIRTDTDTGVSEGLNLGAKSVFNMKFMKDAEARKMREVHESIDDFRREMKTMGVGSGDEGDSGSETDKQQTEQSNVAVHRVGGRMVFNPVHSEPSMNQNMPMPPPPPSAISETSTLKSSEHLSPVVEKLTIPQSLQPEFVPLTPSVDTDTATGLSTLPADADTHGANPWLQIGESSSSKQTKKRNEVIVGKNSSMAQKSESALKKRIGKTSEEKEKARDDAEVEISTMEVLKIPSPSTLKSAETAKEIKKDVKGKSKEKKQVAGLSNNKKQSTNGKDVAQIPHGDSGDDDSDSNSEIEEQERALTQGKGKGKGPGAFEQRDLVARAFAGDNVVKAFEELKRQEINADAPKEVDTTLPGWGSWGGTGTKRAPPKPHLIKKIVGVDPKSRADYGKAHVIISEKKDKKAQKYLVKDLPYPYTSKAQYERSLETPLGTEWNTRVGFQRGTLPRVVKKMGTVIDPLERLF